MTPVLVLTAVGANFDLGALATDLVERRLAACVNIVDGVRSIYRWQGAVEDDREQLAIIKTASECVAELKDALFAKHPYDVPEFVVIEIDRVEGPYRQWLIDSVS